MEKCTGVDVSAHITSASTLDKIKLLPTNVNARLSEVKEYLTKFPGSFRRRSHGFCLIEVKIRGESQSNPQFSFHTHTFTHKHTDYSVLSVLTSSYHPTYMTFAYNSTNEETVDM